MAFLDVRDLAKAFGARPALRGLSFAVERGDVYGLVGPNGSGKTTTLNILCSLIHPDAGRVIFDGSPISNGTRARFGVATQEVALYRDLTCAQNLAFFAGLYRLGRRGPGRIAACLDAVGLVDRRDSLVAELSGGMQRRLHLAVAMLHEPALLLLDEPTVGLDLEVRERLWQLIGGLAAQGGTILLTTHHLAEAESLCRRIGILRDGRLAAEGTLAELRALVPAAELAVVQGPDPAAVRRRAAERGYECRESAAGTTVWLPRRMRLEDVASEFRGVPLRAILLKAVGLEEVYAEVTRRPDAPQP